MSYRVHYITNYEQAKVFSNKIRMRIIALFSDSIPKTSKQISDLIGLPPAKVHYHVRELFRVGLLELVETKEKGGVIEKYYLPIADDFEMRLSQSEESARLQEGQMSGRYVMAKGVLDEYRDSFLHQVQLSDRKRHEQFLLQNPNTHVDESESVKETFPIRSPQGIQSMALRILHLTAEQQSQFLHEIQEVFHKWDIPNNHLDPATTAWRILFAIHKGPKQPNTEPGEG